MAKWIDLGPLDDFPPGSKICTKAQGKSVVIINRAGKLLAVSNACPHAGLPLGDGEVTGDTITCPYHGYTYNLETGCNIDFPHDEPPVPRFAVRSENGRVEIELETPLAVVLAGRANP